MGVMDGVVAVNAEKLQIIPTVDNGLIMDVVWCERRLVMDNIPWFPPAADETPVMTALTDIAFRCCEGFGCLAPSPSVIDLTAEILCHIRFPFPIFKTKFQIQIANQKPPHRTAHIGGGFFVPAKT